MLKIGLKNAATRIVGEADTAVAQGSGSLPVFATPAMIAFMEVSSFGIGTSTMYLATVHPLLILFAAVGILTGRRPSHANA